MDDDFDAPPTTNPEEDLSLPKGNSLTNPATMSKLIQELLPADISCAKETKELLTDCCVEFIHLISSESNEVCEKENKKTIAGDHVISALKGLGFDDYVKDMEELLVEHQKNVKQDREKKISKKDKGMSEEELQKLQEDLLAQSRERFQSGMHAPTE